MENDCSIWWFYNNHRQTKRGAVIDSIFSNELVFKDGKLEDVIINVTSDKAAKIRSTR